MKKFILSLVLFLGLGALAEETTDEDRLVKLNGEIRDHIDLEEYDQARKLIHIVNNLRKLIDPVVFIRPEPIGKVISSEVVDGKVVKERVLLLVAPDNWREYKILQVANVGDFSTLNGRSWFQTKSYTVEFFKKIMEDSPRFIEGNSFEFIEVNKNYYDVDSNSYNASYASEVFNLIGDGEGGILEGFEGKLILKLGYSLTNEDALAIFSL